MSLEEVGGGTRCADYRPQHSVGVVLVTQRYTTLGVPRLCRTETFDILMNWFLEAPAQTDEPFNAVTTTRTRMSLSALHTRPRITACAACALCSSLKVSSRTGFLVDPCARYWFSHDRSTLRQEHGSVLTSVMRVAVGITICLPTIPGHVTSTPNLASDTDRYRRAL